MPKPELRQSMLLTLSVANLGTAIAFALQQANMARIFQSLGAELDALPVLMITGPVTGLIVQPLVGYYSDRTWGRFGRRRPYFMVGAVLAGLALCGMPYAGTVLLAAALLWLLDIALNVTIEPFRAFVGDMVPAAQRARGFAYNTVLGCSGAIIGSLAPYLFSLAGISNLAPEGQIPPSVTAAFLVAALALVLAVSFTVLRVREHPPELLADEDHEEPLPTMRPRYGWRWLLAGLAAVALVFALDPGWELYIIASTIAGMGVAQIISRSLRDDHALVQILSDIAAMPEAMRKLALTHSPTWFAMFALFAFATPVVTQYAFGAAAASAPGYSEGADWVGVLYGAFNAVSALFALAALPQLARLWGAARAHLVGLAVGAASFVLLAIARDKYWLLVPFAGIGIAWASLLTLPYVILAGALPPRKLGTYVGVFNLFIVMPQLLAAAALGPAMRAFFPADPRWAMVVAGAVMALAALSMLRLGDDRRADAGPLAA